MALPIDMRFEAYSQMGTYIDLRSGELVTPAILAYSQFEAPHQLSMKVLKDGIIDFSETPSDMINRVATNLFKQEFRYDLDPKTAQDLANEFVILCDSRKIVMGTPILTNAGRHSEMPLSSCSVIPVNFDERPSEALEYMHAYHKASIGLGIDLTPYENPLETAVKINEEVLKASRRGDHERRIGNMGTISVYHPRVIDVVKAKTEDRFAGYEWRFNFSIDCDEKFIRAVAENRNVQLLDGSEVNARELMKEMTDSAAQTGDPGLIFLDRLNANNPTPGVGCVKSTAPCAEVGLIEGEACQFAYINLGEFVDGNDVDQNQLKRTVFLLTRALDNAMDISIENLAHPLGKDVMSKKRKIGIGICGLADMLAKLDIAYDSDEAREMGRDLLTLISYTSKMASVELAEARGSAEAMNLHLNGTENLHYADQAMLLKFARDTKYVSDQQWQKLITRIKHTRMLRNVSTIALPPTGRSSLIIGASNGIEPWFTVMDADNNVHPVLIEKLKKAELWSTELESKIKGRQTIQEIKEIPQSIRDIFVTATELTPEAHLLMTAALQECNDEAASKTVNMPAGSTGEDVYNIYMTAHEMGLCGITIYVDGSRSNQPKKLVK